MQTLGYFLMVAGFLFGAYSTALDVQATDWRLFVPAAVIAATGLLLAKRGARGAATAEHVLSANRAELESSLGRIVSALGDIVEEQDAIGIDGLRRVIDERLRDDLRRFAEARESMIHLFGIQAYADIMSEFAAGERNVNRVWSASADGYAAEAGDYLVRSLTRFRTARQRLEGAAASATARRAIT